jgi:hypothetical protein
MDHPFSPTLVQRHVQRAQHQFRVQMARHGPADDAQAEHIEHHGQIQEPFTGRHVGGVRHPQYVAGFGAEVPAHQIRGAPRSRALARGDLPAPPACATQTGHAHQARHALASHMHSLARELHMNARRTVGATRARV